MAISHVKNIMALMDKVNPETRSRNMARIKGKNTKPEMLVRSLLHQMGYRFRLHSAKLPGKPDIVLPRYKAVIFVHGCFWHGHADCKRAALPTTRKEFWADKIWGNIQRDERNIAALGNLGYRCFIVWQCELKDTETLKRRLCEFLSREQTGNHCDQTFKARRPGKVSQPID